MSDTELTTVEDIPTLPTVQTDPMQMLGAAIERGMSVSDLGPLMDLVERDQANKARVAFMAAMADFQAGCPTIHKSRKADRYTYAPLDEVLRTIRPHLDAAGLSIRFDTSMTGETIITATCTVSHRDGHCETSEFSAPIDPNMRVNETQKVGSANSYARRYALMNALNLVASDDDDDGFSAGTPLITDKQVIELQDHFESLEIDVPAFLKYMGAESVDQIPAAKWPAAMKAIDRKREAK